MTNSHKRWLTILSLVAIPALLYAVLAERASWRPRIWHVTLGHIQSVAFSPDGKLLAVGVFLSRQQPGAVFLWNIANSRVERHLDVPTAPVQTVAFAPTGQQLAASTNDEILLWDTASGRRQGALPGRELLGFTTDRQTGLACVQLMRRNVPPAIETWATRPPRKLRERLMALPPYLSLSGSLALPQWLLHGNPIVLEGLPLVTRYIAATAPDGQATAVAVETLPSRSRREAVLFDPAPAPSQGSTRRAIAPRQLTPPATPAFSFQSQYLVRAIAFASDSKVVAVAGQSVQLYDAPTGAFKFLCAASEQPITLAFAPDGNTLAGSCHSQILLWNPHTGQVLRTLDTAPPAPPHLRNEATALAFSPDGATLAAGYGNGTLKLWRIK